MEETGEKCLKPRCMCACVWVCVWVCVCVRERQRETERDRDKVGCHQLLLGLSGCILAVSIPPLIRFPLFPARLTHLTLTVSCNSCKTFCSTESFHAFFTPALSLWCFYRWFTLALKYTHTHTITHTEMHLLCYRLRMGI